MYEPDRDAINSLSKSLTKVVNRFLEKGGYTGEDVEPEQNVAGLRLAIAGVCEVLGMLDVPLRLYGVLGVEVDLVTRLHSRHGRLRALHYHDKNCEGCEAADDLRNELLGS